MKKLVRDKIPYIMIKEYKSINISRATDEFKALYAKMEEEFDELKCAINHDSSKDEILEELADCVEVLMAITKQSGNYWGKVIDTSTRKRNDVGGFDEFCVIEWND